MDLFTMPENEFLKDEYFGIFAGWYSDRREKTNMEDLTQEQLIALHEKAKLIKLNPVLSTNIGGIGYDAENKLLKVAFKTKTGSNTYLYEGVEPETYESLYLAESIGRQLSESVIKHKEKYRYIKL